MGARRTFDPFWRAPILSDEKNRRKRLRAQPRKATPPVSFRSEETGDRTILLVDESFSTDSFARTNSRQPIFLRLGPGLRILLESRRVAKRRFAQLRIEAVIEPTSPPN